MYTYGYLYANKFNPLNPSANLINEDHDHGCNGQFKLIHYLQKEITYILVVTTFSPNETGSFSVISLGLNGVILKHSSEYIL